MNLRNTADREKGTRCPSLSLRETQCLYNSVTMATTAKEVPHLDIIKQLPQAPWRHHHGCVQLSDVAFAQGNVVISCEALE